MVWAMLMINVVSASGDMLVPVPRGVLQMVTMGCLAVAFLLALRINPRLTVQFSVYLTVLTVLALLALVSSARLESGLGALVRSVRFFLFVGTLWLLTPWWRGDLRFVRLQVTALTVILATVLAGMVANPGLAFSGATGGRLAGVLWPIPPTQVGEYGALAAGLVILLWISGEMNGRRALLIVMPAVACLLLSHTRTAFVGFFVGLSVAGVGMIATSRRARRAIGVVALLGAVAVLSLQEVLIDWFQRDQGDEAISGLTGRTKVWDALLAKDRSTSEQLIGVGLGDKSYGGLSIDSTWLSTYHELGQFGVALVGLMLISLLAAALFRPPSLARRCAVFLIVYCIVASYTEVGLGDASPYLLHLAMAASLLAAPRARADEFGPAGG
jgi:O-antigen ligase